MTITLVPGIEIKDTSKLTQPVTPYGLAYLLVSANKGIPKSLVSVTDTNDFIAKFGDSPSLPYVEAFFSNLTDNRIQLTIYRVNPNVGDPPSDPNGINPNRRISGFSDGFSLGFGATESSSGTPQVVTLNDWLEALNTIDPSSNPGGIILMPEAFENESQANREKFVNDLTAFCDLSQDSYWLAFADTSLMCDNLSDAISETSGYLSADGSVSVFTPPYSNTDGTYLLPSAAMAAKYLSNWVDGAYYQSAAGTNYPIANATGLKYHISSKEYGNAHKSRLNVIRYYSNYGYVPFDVITLATAEEFTQIPTVVCYRMVAYLLKRALSPLLFDTLGGAAEIIGEAEAVMNSVLFACWQARYLVGNNVNEAYEIKRTTQILPSPVEAILEYEIGVRPAYSVVKYRILLSNILSDIIEVI